MNQDLKIIKKKYGEKMMHLCRELFPTILETEGALSQILLEKFESCRFLYEDIIRNGLTEEFKSCIYSIFDSSFRSNIDIEKTPFELMDESGYILYECKTEEDIQGFRKYYKKEEELCTFRGGRLNSCYVYFAVKKNVDEIRRKDFKNPKRQDLYGTSVISIQFTKDSSHILSIKNRYNHTVENPDATFGNNLDNIISGLTYSFEKYYGMKQKVKSNDFEMPGYVMANDGRYYKYNIEINNVYYCPNNIIIDNFHVKRYSKEKYVVFDRFLLDLNMRKIKSCDFSKDSFVKSIGECDKVEIYKEKNVKRIILKTKNKEDIIIIIDEMSNLISLENPNVIEINENFLCHCESIRTLKMDNLKIVGNNFLRFSKNITEINFPSLESVGDNFFQYSDCVYYVKLPNCKSCGNSFLQHNDSYIEIFNMPSLETVGNYFCSDLRGISPEKINLQNLKKAGNGFFTLVSMSLIDFPNLESVGDDFCQKAQNAFVIKLPKLKKAGARFLKDFGVGKSLKEAKSRLDLQSLEEVGEDSFAFNERLKKSILNKENTDRIKVLNINKKLVKILKNN